MYQNLTIKIINLPATDKILSDDELDNVIYEPKPRQSKAHSTGNKYVIRVEDVTQVGQIYYFNCQILIHSHSFAGNAGQHL